MSYTKIVNHGNKGGQRELFGAPAGAVPVINPDGSVKGSKVIYAPKGPAGEYAPLAGTLYNGCGHGCDYPCYVYAGGFTRLTREQFDAGATLKPNVIADLRKDAAKYQ